MPATKQAPAPARTSDVGAGHARDKSGRDPRSLQRTPEAMSKPFTVTIEDGIAEMVFNHPPVNAFNSAGWAAIAAELDALGRNQPGQGGFQWLSDVCR